MEKIIKMEATQPISVKFLDEFLVLPDNSNRRANDFMEDASYLLDIDFDLNNITSGCESGYLTDFEKP